MTAAPARSFRPNSVTLVVPAYNEEAILADSVERQRAALERFGVPFEVIVVDDGSQDRTAEIAAELSARFDEVRLIRLPRNSGVGAAIWAGYRSARSDWVFANAADAPLDLSDLPALFGSGGEADVIVVCRLDRAANSRLRRVTSLVNYWLIRLLFRAAVHDFQFVQLYRSAIIRDLQPKATDTFMPPELLLRALRSGARCIEVRARFHARRAGSSSYNDPRRYLRTIREMLLFWVETRRHRVPVGRERQA